MTRTTTLTTVGILAAALASTSAVAETLIVSNGLSPTHVVSAFGFDPWMACVTEATKGEIDFNYFPSGQIAPVKGSIDALNSGLAQIAFVSPSNESSKLPLNGIPMLPGMGNSAAEMVRAYRAAVGGSGAMAAELATNNIRPIVVNTLPPYQIMASGGPIDAVDKFSGKKVRAAGGALTFGVTALGGVPVEMPAGDMYVAMQRGTVDATVLAMASVKAYAMQELLKSMSGNGSFGTSAQMIAISTEAWDKLSPANQEAMATCGLQTEAALAAHLDVENETLKAEFAALGINVFQITPEAQSAISARLETVATDYIAQLSARGLPAQAVYDEYRALLGM